MKHSNSGLHLPGRAVLLAMLGSTLLAEQLPVRLYTTSDGLPSSYIQKIVADSRGLLWFCTRDGLSRFDGSRFISYSVKQGLSHPHVNHLLETRKGIYWVATNGGGVNRFDPKGSGTAADGSRILFTAVAVGNDSLSNRVNVLYEDRRERVWVGTDNGVFRLEQGNGTHSSKRIKQDPASEAPVTSFAEDAHGNLWVGTYSGLSGIAPDDRVISHPQTKADRVNALLFDSDGKFWIGYNSHGLHVIAPDGSSKWYTAGDGLPANQISGVIQAGGQFWIGAIGLSNFDGKRFRTYTKEHGVDSIRRGSMAADRSGNLWMAASQGAVKLAIQGFSRYGAADGFQPTRVTSIFEDPTGGLIASGLAGGGHFAISRFYNRRFHPVQLELSHGARPPWPQQGVYVDRGGGWWLLTNKGLWRFDVTDHRQLRHRKPIAVYNRSRGLTHERIVRVYEDREGDLWIGSSSGEAGGLARWERRADRLWHYSEVQGLPQQANTATAFAEDRSGRLWVGFQFGGVAVRIGDRFRYFGPADSLSPTAVTALHVDQRGRLWIASNAGGLTLAEDIDRDRPRFRNYTVSHGLSSNNVRSITEDRWGRIYAGTVRGVDRLDPETGRVRRYTPADGLAGDFITTAFRDREGALWFGSITATELSRLDPVQSESRQPPPIWIRGLRVAGSAYPISEIGDASVGGLEVAAASNSIQIDFFGLSFGAGEVLRYDFMLEGADRDWSTPSEQTTVRYASLSSGSYRFLVRARSLDGNHSVVPAAVSFTVLAPWWRRWWALTTAALLVLSMLYAAHRLRMKQLLAVERLRQRIAADLHDDIGASLSRVAVLSEVVRSQVVGEPSRRRLAEIANTARGLVDSMGDIVWSVDSRRDDLNSVVLRIRDFAADVLADGVAVFELKAPEGLASIPLDPERRRHLFLILKESLNNAARHSGARSVRLSFAVDSTDICVEIEDDGSGFDPSLAEGNGLRNIRLRAAQLGGDSQIRSGPRVGTLITVKIPWRGRSARKQIIRNIFMRWR